jgi:hypothetical protein
MLGRCVANCRVCWNGIGTDLCRGEAWCCMAIHWGRQHRSTAAGVALSFVIVVQRKDCQGTGTVQEAKIGAR